MKTQRVKVTKIKKELEVQIIVYANVSYGGENSISQNGSLATQYVGPVILSSWRQNVVYMSITEAEYNACSEIAKDS